MCDNDQELNDDFRFNEEEHCDVYHSYRDIMTDEQFNNLLKEIRYDRR